MTNQPAPNRLIDETSPYLLQHAHNPVDWYPVGPRGPGAGPGRGQADPALDRLRGLPLVPRDGARVVRGRRDGRPDEPRLRLRQGRPRGAARPGRHLHGRRPGHDRPRRLADDGVPDPRGRARSTPAPTTPRPTGRACPASAGCWPRWPTPGPGGATTPAARATRSCRCWPPSPAPWAATATASWTTETLRQAFEGLAGRVRRHLGRVRGRAQVPPADDARVPAPLPPARVRGRWAWSG